MSQGNDLEKLAKDVEEIKESIGTRELQLDLLIEIELWKIRQESKYLASAKLKEFEARAATILFGEDVNT